MCIDDWFDLLVGLVRVCTMLRWMSMWILCEPKRSLVSFNAVSTSTIVFHVALRPIRQPWFFGKPESKRWFYMKASFSALIFKKNSYSSIVHLPPSPLTFYPSLSTAVYSSTKYRHFRFVFILTKYKVFLLSASS